MPLGTTYNNAAGGGYQQRDYNPTTYSKYKMSNPNSSVDPTALSFNFWKGMLKIMISPKKRTNDDTIAFDHENAISIYLSHTRAGILKNEILAFLDPANNYKNRGVSTNRGCIYICDGSEFGCEHPCLVIRLVDGETGDVVSSIAYEFNTSYHFAIRNYKSDDKTFERVFDEYDTREIFEFVTILDQFEKAMTNAIAASVVDCTYYMTNNIQNNLNTVAEKLGVATGRKSVNSYNSKSSFFNSSANGTTTSGNKPATQYSSYEDLEFGD